MRKPSKVDPLDPAALSAWLAETRTLVHDLHALALDATARRGQRHHARAYLREGIRHRFQTLNAFLAALDTASAQPPAPPTAALTLPKANRPRPEHH